MGVTDGVVLNPGPGVFGHLLHLHTGRVVAQLTIFFFFIFALILRFQTWNEREIRKMCFYYLVLSSGYDPSLAGMPHSRLGLLLIFFCTFVWTWEGVTGG